ELDVRTLVTRRIFWPFICFSCSPEYDAQSPHSPFSSFKEKVMNAARVFVLSVAATAVSLGALAAADWPAFRGEKCGVADDKNLPVKWTKENFLWKVKLPGPGASSPIIRGDKILLTCYDGYGLKLTKGFEGFGKGGFGKGGGKGGFGKGG